MCAGHSPAKFASLFRVPLCALRRGRISPRSRDFGRFGSVLCFSSARVARPWARRLAFRLGAKSVFGLPPSLSCSRAGAVAAPSWRVRADVCRIHERSSSPWTSAQPRPRATTRVRPYGEGDHKSCPYGSADVWLVLRRLPGRRDWTVQSDTMFVVNKLYLPDVVGVSKGAQL